jgi:hypothetical protein
MSRTRFATARALFEHFPGARERIKAAPTEASPPRFVRDLVSSGTLEDAISFCAYLLARREAVWWGCRSVRVLLGDTLGNNQDALRAAEAWAQEPGEERRLNAYEIANRSDRDSATTWLALATAWSGGSISRSSQKPVPTPPQLTAQATRTAILLAARLVKAPERDKRLRACVEDALTIAENGI